MIESTDNLIITISSFGRKVSVEVSDGVDIYELTELIAGMLITSGYHPNSVTNGMQLYVENHSDDNAGDLDS